MRISDWSSDVCSSDLAQAVDAGLQRLERPAVLVVDVGDDGHRGAGDDAGQTLGGLGLVARAAHDVAPGGRQREIGRASCRVSVCPYVLFSVVSLSLHIYSFSSFSFSIFFFFFF